MFKAMHLMRRRKAQKPAVADETGRFAGSDSQAAAVVRSHFMKPFLSVEFG